jgi:hypothetical protein
MQAFSSTTQAAPSSIIGCEPFPIVTYAVSLTAGQGTLKAGTFIDAAGLKTATIANVHGVLAYDVTTDATIEIGATLYTSGSFIRDRIESANSGVTFDQAAIDSLRTKNIYLERAIGY